MRVEGMKMEMAWLCLGAYKKEREEEWREMEYERSKGRLWKAFVGWAKKVKIYLKGKESHFV